MATVKVTRALVQQALQETNWAAVDAQTDEDIARNVAGDPDAAPILSAAKTAAAIARSVRKRLGISQAEFSARYHVRSARCGTGSRTENNPTHRPWPICA